MAQGTRNPIGLTRIKARSPRFAYRQAMAAIHTLPAALPQSSWRELVLPKEHGSWSLAFEPVALGLLAAPSRAGVWFGLAIAAAFFARRPLRIAWRDSNPARRDAARCAVFICAASVAVFFLGAILVAGAAWLPWLLPSCVAGAIFARFDVRNAGRDPAAEVAGAAAFALLPGAFAILAGWPALTAVALAVVMLGRAVPTVLCVRAVLRGAKGGEHRIAPALMAAAAALFAGAALARAGLAPWSVVVLLALLAGRAGALLVFPRPAIRARTLGLFEAIAGVVFILTAEATWLC